jgi:hypothetical protein
MGGLNIVTVSWHARDGARLSDVLPAAQQIAGEASPCQY